MSAVELVMLAGLVFLYWAYPKYKKQMMVAFFLSLAWVGTSELYLYKHVNYVLFGINMYPLIAWTAGLTLLYLLYLKLDKNIWVTWISYVIIMFAFEYIFHNYFKVQILKQYDGFLGMKLLHAPMFVQLYYVCIGMVYLLLVGDHD